MVSVRTAVVAATVALLACKPPAASFRDEVLLRRRLAKSRASDASARGRRGLLHDKTLLSGLQQHGFNVLSNSTPVFGLKSWPEEGLWAVDAAAFSFGCNRRGACLLGVFGNWWRLPSWQADWDLWLLTSLHAGSFACCTYDPAAYFRNFAPRLRKPYTLLSSAFAISSIMELLWVCSTLASLGSSLQQSLGRFQFLGLYLFAGGLVVAYALCTRNSSHGHGGTLAISAFHAMMAPRAKHSVMGSQLLLYRRHVFFV
mmetsp:Transcript_33859/g.74311  ORF Transcript_33859/g.74311 Transcript_33859/m.74311 type:complete len:257 (-) Transcript_33859:613-1383(-)